MYTNAVLMDKKYPLCQDVLKSIDSSLETVNVPKKVYRSVDKILDSWRAGFATLPDELGLIWIPKVLIEHLGGRITEYYEARTLSMRSNALEFLRYHVEVVNERGANLLLHTVYEGQYERLYGSTQLLRFGRKDGLHAGQLFVFGHHIGAWDEKTQRVSKKREFYAGGLTTERSAKYLLTYHPRRDTSVPRSLAYTPDVDRVEAIYFIEFKMDENSPILVLEMGG